MKLNLLMYSNTLLGGYTNIDPYPNLEGSQQTFTEEKQQGDVQNLDWIVDDGECDEIIATDIIDFVNIPQKQQIIQNWAKKVKIGGKLTIGGTDVVSVSKALHQSNISLEEAGYLLYGDPNFPFGNRRGCLSLDFMVNFLESIGFRILNKRTIQYTYAVVAERKMV